MSQEKHKKLAIELADALNDMEALPVYQSMAERYTDEFLRKILQKVLIIPESKIRKTRGALFTYLTQNASNAGYRPRD